MKYWQFRACQTIDPNRIYGRPWNKLEVNEQTALIAFTLLRIEEDAPNGDDQ